MFFPVTYLATLDVTGFVFFLVMGLRSNSLASIPNAICFDYYFDYYFSAPTAPWVELSAPCPIPSARILAAPHSRHNREEGTPRCGGGTRILAAPHGRQDGEEGTPRCGSVKTKKKRRKKAGGCHQCVVRVRERSAAKAGSARTLLM
jgi:hypothetical protein